MKIQKIQTDRLTLTCGHHIHLQAGAIQEEDENAFWCDKCDKDRAIVSVNRIEQTIILD